MSPELSKDAVLLKLASPWECTLISVYEYCYAACRMKLSAAEVEDLRGIRDLSLFKKKMAEYVNASSVWTQTEHGERLRKMLLSCRIQGEIGKIAAGLFEEGLKM